MSIGCRANAVQAGTGRKGSRAGTLRNHIWGMGLAAAIGLVLTGCGPDPKQRVGLLEDQNRNLTDELNRARAELEAAQEARDFAARQAADAAQENSALRGQLANRPVERVEVRVPVEAPAPPGWVNVPGGAMIAIDDSVLFQSGKAVLRPEAKRALDAVASTIQGQYGEKEVLVYGHTDDQPIKKSGWQDNWELSANRALAVVRYLKDKGVDASRLTAAGVGDTRPRAPNTAEGRAKNRRVEIFALDASVRGAPRDIALHEPN